MIKVKQLIADLEEIRQECSDTTIDLVDVEEKLQFIIDELKLSRRGRYDKV